MGKLHDQMREDVLLKAYSPHTQNGYLRCARHFASRYMRSPSVREKVKKIAMSCWERAS